MSAADPVTATVSLEATAAAWRARWPEALARWSRYVQLHPPRFCLTSDDEKREQLGDTFALIRLTDHSVVIGLPLVMARGVADFPVEIMAHEIGHHVHCPGTLADQGRLIARMRRGLPSRESDAPLCANLYADLMVNDRLQREAGLDLAGLYRRLAGATPSRLWTMYMRTFEVLWRLPRGELATALRDRRDDVIEGDALLAARLVRSYGRDWLDGAGRFAALCLPYLLDEPGAAAPRAWTDLRDAGRGGEGETPDGLARIDEGELEGAIHPHSDPRLTGFDAEGEGQGKEDGAARDREGAAQQARSTTGGATAQYREPYEYGTLLRALGLNLTEHDAAVRYYRERARPHLVRFPARLQPRVVDPLPEGVETWSLGAPLEEIDWLETVIASPQVVPGVTTMQRTFGTAEGDTPARQPVDLDLYVDSSGSMPNPQTTTSYLALAGAIVALSALRAGSRVKVTLWSGQRQIITTRGFVRDEAEVLRVLTGFYGGGTAFPLHVLRDTHAETRRPGARACHVLVISDDGISTMLQPDEQKRPGREVAREALERAGGGGTLVLQMVGKVADHPVLVDLGRDGWQIHLVSDWPQLVAFARRFSDENYAQTAQGSGA